MTESRKLLVCVLLLSGLLSAPDLAKAKSKGSGLRHFVSIISLIAIPERYDKHQVVCIGYLHYRLEDTCLFLSKQDSDHSIHTNGIWLSIYAKGNRESGKFSDLKKLDGKCVIADGVLTDLL